MTAHARLKERFARIARINEAAAFLSWDKAVMMPVSAAPSRGAQLAALAGIAHELLCDPATAADLAVATADDDWEHANLALMHEAHQRATALPVALVEALSRAGAACETLWRQARPESDFPMVRAALVEVVNLTRQKAAILAGALGLSAYDALLGEFQRGVGAEDIAPLFAEYEIFLREALPAVEDIQARDPPALPPGPFPEPVQEALCRRLSAAAGLDFRQARLDRSAHPFSGGTPDDLRITVRYDPQDFCSALLATLHETGHALYEQNLPRAFRNQPVGAAAGMAVHESQSLMIEMQAARSDAYLRYLTPVLAEAFGCAITPAALSSRLRRVERSFIRVEADEMTYPAHIILRFRLERALIAGEVEVADLPDAWNEGMRALLGVTPPDDRRGCLQDIHWYDGAFGYFPFYSLGAMAAAQMMASARLALPDLDDHLLAGDLSPLVGWLRDKVHARGGRFGFNELLRQVTGEPLGMAAFRRHLTRRYLT